MLSSEWKEIVREQGTLPAVVAAVTDLALCGKSCRGMVRFPRLLVVFRVTRETIGRSGSQLEISMAVYTVQCPVDAGQRKTRIRPMVPPVGRHPFPAEGSVAVGAVCTEAEPIPVVPAPLPVTGLTRGGGSLEDEAQMAVPALGRAVSPDQGEIGVVMGRCGPLILILLLLRHTQGGASQYHQHQCQR